MKKQTRPSKSAKKRPNYKDGTHSKKPLKVKGNPGRPTKYSQEIADKICQHIRAGAYVETAAAACGINKTTLYEWLKNSARGKTQNGFSNAIEKAQADAELFDSGVITKAAINGQWQAAAWRLERKHPDRYGRRTVISGDKNAPVMIGVVPEKMAEIKDLIASEADGE